ncbi:MAG: hypothetical protein ACRDYD_06430, partial [Acidimicrobiales bacterium]
PPEPLRLLTPAALRRAPPPGGAGPVGEAAGATARVLSRRPASEAIEVVSATPVVVVRSVAWDRGWRATVSSARGPARPARLLRVGLVQGVRVPAGTHVLRLSYSPPRLALAAALSALAVAILLLAGLAWLVAGTLRRRGHGGGAGAQRWGRWRSG